MKCNGWCILNKPKGISSNAALSTVKRLFNSKKAGYIGTLDPLAHGVLVLAFGEATKAINYVDQSRKSYKFIVKFGVRTDSYDLEGEVLEKNEFFPLLKDLEESLPNFVGKILQKPPIYSAIKIDGQRAYKLARLGKEVEIKAREVEIYSLRLLQSFTKEKFNGVESAEFLVECSSGTYVRSLAVDIAEKIGAISVVTDICRLQSGSFLIEDAISLEKLQKIVHTSELESVLKPILFALDDIPAMDILDSDRQEIIQGKKISINSEDHSVVIAKMKNEVIAIGEQKDGFFVPRRVFNYN